MGATLFSEGACHDADEAQPSVVKGDMWAFTTLFLLKLIAKLHCIRIQKS